MRKVLALCLILTGMAAALAWQTFQPPDKSFSVDFPGPARAASKNNQQILMWGFSEPGKFGYAAGYGVLPGYGKLKGKEQAAAMEEVISGMTGEMTNVKRTSGGPDTVDISGTMAQQGVDIKLRVISDGPRDRVYLLMTTGEADTRRFHRSFKLH